MFSFTEWQYKFWLLALLTSTHMAKGTNGKCTKAHAAVMRAKKAAKHSADDSGYADDSTEADLDAPPETMTGESEESTNAPKRRKAPKDMKKSTLAVPSVMQTRSRGVSDTISKKTTGTSAPVTHEQQVADIGEEKVKTHRPSRKAAAAVHLLFDQISLDSDENGGDEDRDVEGDEDDNSDEEGNTLDEDDNDSDLGLKFIPPLRDPNKVTAAAAGITTKPTKKDKVLESDSEDNGKPTVWDC